MLRNPWIVALVLFLAGCVGPESKATSQEATPKPPETSLDPERPLNATWPPDGRIPLAQYHPTQTAVAWDALCAFGGGALIERGPERVVDETVQIVLQLRIPRETVTLGTRIGYAFDGNQADAATNQQAEIHWSPALRPGQDGSWPIRVQASQLETSLQPTRWDFYWDINPGHPDLCTTGVASHLVDAPTFQVWAERADAAA